MHREKSDLLLFAELQYARAQEGSLGQIKGASRFLDAECSRQGPGPGDGDPRIYWCLTALAVPSLRPILHDIFYSFFIFLIPTYEFGRRATAFFSVDSVCRDGAHY